MTLEITDRSVRHAWPRTEDEILHALAIAVRREWPVTAMAMEVRSHGRCRTDLCLRTHTINSPSSPHLLIGIEAKKTDWKRALRQAILNQHAVHISMVAMPTQRVTPELVAVARDHGVGVLGVARDSLTVLSLATVGSPDVMLLAKMDDQLRPVRRLRPRAPSRIRRV